ncbi:M14 family metallopeptidase [Marinobacterium jannaschii]|uniref:M14 family metallopeptidase n=1 Tax=Marinobacterium jannaschii TaxID=64970 RepID=UPI0004884264|nr:M14 family metallopeptidase [Marinobacterium jannaschii]
MTRIFSRTIAPTIDQLIAQYAVPARQGQMIEAWLFNDLASRQAAEAAFVRRGIKARFHSAYKPLLHFFLEEIGLKACGVTDIHIRYPQHEQATEKRFRLEAYPLSALVGETPVRFEPNSGCDSYYEITLSRASGLQTQHRVFAPNRLHQDAIGATHYSPTGWLRVFDADNRLLQDERLETDYERLFSDTMAAIVRHDWGVQEPYFGELNISVRLPGADHTIAHDHEVISLFEALHEDLYFSAQEYFQVRAGRTVDDREGQPGQIVPEIRSGGRALSVVVESRSLSGQEIEGPLQELDAAVAPLSTAQIATELAKVDGDPFSAESRAGRRILARYRKGADAPVMISGGQHSNETTGVVGALRAAQKLAQRDNCHFTISPLENPDGYALHQRLIVENPHHMHHAARYTALGDDLGYRTGGPLYEKEIRRKAQALSQARLHINLHGYPSHEWTRPLSGYVPRGFDMWTLPKGFFLILRHCSQWREQAEQFIHRVTASLAAIPELMAFNRSQLEHFRIYAGESGFRVVNGFPCMISADEAPDVPLQLITEYPDETIYGKDFIKAHSIQMATVIAAYDAHQAMSR